jgi:zinc transporter ZupT
MKLPFLSEEESWALTLTTFAGLSTSVGAAFAVGRGDDAFSSASRNTEGDLLPVVRPRGAAAAAAACCCSRLSACLVYVVAIASALQVIKQPDDSLLAFLLGNAIGVMFLLSVAEMCAARLVALPCMITPVLPVSRQSCPSPAACNYAAPPICCRWFHNAMVHGWAEITFAFGLGALLYQVAQPFIPDFGHHDHHLPRDFGKVIVGASYL